MDKDGNVKPWFSFLQNMQSLMLAALVSGGSWFGVELWRSAQSAAAVLHQNRESMIRIETELRLRTTTLERVEETQRQVLHRLDVLESKKP